jgi:hypothetical protein
MDTAFNISYQGKNKNFDYVTTGVVQIGSVLKNVFNRLIIKIPRRTLRFSMVLRSLSLVLRVSSVFRCSYRGVQLLFFKVITITISRLVCLILRLINLQFHLINLQSLNFIITTLRLQL